MSAKALAQDMYIEELERSLGDAARIMLDNGCHGDQSQQLSAWLNAAAARASYSHKQRTHIQVLSSTRTHQRLVYQSVYCYMMVRCSAVSMWRLKG